MIPERLAVCLKLYQVAPYNFTEFVKAVLQRREFEDKQFIFLFRFRCSLGSESDGVNGCSFSPIGEYGGELLC